MNRRKIDNIEAHRRDVRKTCLAVLKRTVASWLVRLLSRAGTRKNLIPRGEASLLAVHHHRQLFRVPGDQTAIGVAPADSIKVVVKRDCAAIIGLLAPRPGPLPKPSSIVSLRALLGPLATFPPVQ